MADLMLYALGALILIGGVGHLIWEDRDLKRETAWVTDPRNPLPYDRRLARRRRNRR